MAVKSSMYFLQYEDRSIQNRQIQNAHCKNSMFRNLPELRITGNHYGEKVRGTEEVAAFVTSFTKAFFKLCVCF